MDTKKTYKADLEHRRKYILLAAFIGVTALFLVALEIPLAEPAADLSMADIERLAADTEYVPMADTEAVPTDESAAEPDVTDNIRIVDEDVTAEELTLEGETVDGPAEEAEEAVVAEAVLPPTIADGPVLRVVECLPEFPGGMAAFTKWLTDNLHYPPSARKQKVEGRVVVSFVVNADGTITNHKVVTPADDRLDSEALRVIGLMPPWTPGKDRGEPCRTMMVLPIVFAL